MAYNIKDPQTDRIIRALARLNGEADGPNLAAVIEAAKTPFTSPLAIFEAFRRFGKGRRPARLDLGDCFPYACAMAHRAPFSL
jgi:uncharacterized protein with PIN domain